MQIFYNFMQIFYNFMQIFYSFFANFMRIFLQILCKFYTIFLQIFFANIMQIFIFIEQIFLLFDVAVNIYNFQSAGTCKRWFAVSVHGTSDRSAAQSVAGQYIIGCIQRWRNAGSVPHRRPELQVRSVDRIHPSERHLQRLESSAVRRHFDHWTQFRAESCDRQRTLDVRNTGLGLFAGGSHGNPRYRFLPPSGRICLGIRAHGKSWWSDVVPDGSRFRQSTPSVSNFTKVWRINFIHPVAEIRYFRLQSQVVYTDGSATETLIEISLKHPGKQNGRATRNHRWAVYVNPVGQDAAVESTPVRCVAAGYPWNPAFVQLVDPRNVQIYLKTCFLLIVSFVWFIRRKTISANVSRTCRTVAWSAICPAAWATSTSAWVATCSATATFPCVSRFNRTALHSIYSNSKFLSNRREIFRVGPIHRHPVAGRRKWSICLCQHSTG